MSIFLSVLTLGILHILVGLLARFGLRRLTCRREFSCKEAFEGEDGELVETVGNNSPFIIPWVRLESYIGMGLQLGRKDNSEAPNATHHCSCFTLMPWQQIRRRHYVKFARRGVYDLGNAAISVGNLLGTGRSFKDQQLSTCVTVYPSILNEEDLPYPMTRILGELVTKNRLQQDPFMIRSIRPYQPGDLIRDIHWQATARTEELQVAVHDNTVYPRLLVVLNAQHSDNQWDDYIREDVIPVVEQNIRLAASMCVYGIRSGLEVGFAVNMPRKSGGESTVVLPGGGMDRQDALLSAFAQLQVHCSGKFISLLQSLRGYEDMDIVVLSGYTSESIQREMQELERCGNRVTLCLTEGGH